MKLYFGVTTFKWLISPQEELYHGLTTFEWIFPLFFFFFFFYKLSHKWQVNPTELIAPFTGSLIICIYIYKKKNKQKLHYLQHILSTRLDNGRHEWHLTHILLNVCGALMLYISLKYNFITFFYYKFYFLLDDQSYRGNIHSNVVTHDITFPEDNHLTWMWWP